MSSFPLVTAIIATYNRRHYVCDAIDSILNQTYPNVEIIVIDDGSTDNTQDLLQQKYGQRIRYIYQENQGRSEARNRGLKEAKGDYIAFLDSDDIWKPEKLEKQVAFMEMHPECGISHTFTEIIDDTNVYDPVATAKRLKHHRKAYRRGYNYETMSRLCIMFLSTVMIRADILPEAGLMDPNIPAFEDWDWYLRCALITRIGTLPEPLTSYRIHLGNSTSAEFLAGAKLTAEKHIALSTTLSLQRQRIVQCNLYLHLAGVSYKREQTEECAYWLWKAAALNPLAVLRPENIRYTLTAVMPSQGMRRLRQLRRQWFN